MKKNKSHNVPRKRFEDTNIQVHAGKDPADKKNVVPIRHGVLSPRY